MTSRILRHGYAVVVAAAAILTFGPAHAQGSRERMAAGMQMEDTSAAGQVLLEQLEWRQTAQGSAAFWDTQAWYGGDYDKAWLKLEGERVRGATEDARVELLWDHAASRWWNLQVGAREDVGGAPRTWAAVGVQGLAPYRFNVETTLYAGEAGRTAARAKLDHDLLLTQRLVLQPKLELNLYGKSDPARRIGSGVSDLDLGIRLRYEIRRELAPYLGVAWRRRFGSTADQARASGVNPDDVQLVAGMRAWF